MKWIRIEVALGDSPMIGALADALGVSIAEAVGLHVHVWAKLPEHARDGALGNLQVRDATLERWATWTGKRGVFARAYRELCCDGAGVALDWERVNGAAMRESEATAERVRRLRKDRKENAGVTRPVAPTRLLDVRRTPASTYPSDGDGTAVPEKAGTAVQHTDLSKGEPSPQNRVENSDEQHEYADPSPIVTRFMARFYGASTTVRRTDVARQMTGAILHTGVNFKGDIVRAVDDVHLDDACLEVMEEPPRDPNAAWVFVLQRLKDSYLGVLSARTKALAEVPARDRARNVPRETFSPGDDDEDA